jgi:hypothetical protein
VLADDKLGIIDQVPEMYFVHAQRVRKAAEEAEKLSSCFTTRYASKTGVALVRCGMFQRENYSPRTWLNAFEFSNRPCREHRSWSDMFDPNHSPVDRYDLMRGSLSGWWKGLTSEVIIADWNLDHAAESLKGLASAKAH